MKLWNSRGPEAAVAAPKSGDAPACAGLSPSGAMERPLESSTDLKRRDFLLYPAWGE